MIRNKMLAAVITGFSLFGVFVFQNMAAVDLRFLFWKVSLSASLLVLAVFSGGVLAGWVLSKLTHREKEGRLPHLPREGTM